MSEDVVKPALGRDKYGVLYGPRDRPFDAVLLRYALSVPLNT